MQMNELLPCPFCGGEANVIDHHNDDGSVSVGCNNDTCLGFSGLGWLYKTEAEAIAAWNSRAELTCEFAPDGMMDDRLWFSCSNCGGYITTDYGMPSYCPHCGARTVGE